MRLDEMEQLVQDSEISVAVLGLGTEFLLVPLGDDWWGSGKLTDAHQRGFQFCGVLGLLRNGRPAAKCADADSIPLMLLAAATFGAQIGERLLREQKSGNSLRWLERLWTLRDMRDN